MKIRTSGTREINKLNFLGFTIYIIAALFSVKSKKQICLAMAIFLTMFIPLLPAADVLDVVALKGIYVLYNARPDINFTTRAGSTLTNPHIEGYAMKYRWSDLQPTPTTYNWDYMINNIKTATGSGKKVFLWVNMVWWAPEWLYSEPYNVTKFFYKDYAMLSDGSGNAILQDAQLPLPWDQTYLSQCKAFITALKSRLTQRGGFNDLTDVEYNMILKINISNPGGTRDTFEMHTGKDSLTMTGAVDERVGFNYVHDYDYEWKTGKYNPARGTISINPIITTDVYSDTKLFNAAKNIADHTADTFPDKFIGRTIFFTKNSFTRPTLENFINYLAVNTTYKDRIVLEDNSLDADGVKTNDTTTQRYTPLEYHRVNNKTLIGFEMLWSSDNPRFNDKGLTYPLRQALINGIDRGADCIQIYMKDAKDPALQEDIVYAKNLLKNLSPDEINPTDVNIISAVPGANSGELKIDFIAPGDDYDSKTLQPAGEVNRYIVKYSTNPIITSLDFDSALTYPQNWIPARAGRSEGDGTQISFSGNVYLYLKVLTGLNPGQLYYVAIKAKDDMGKISGGFVSASGVTSGIPDTTPPVISNIQVSNITVNSAIISWLTDEAASSQVNYGLDINYGNSVADSVNLTTSHSLTLTGLNANTLYHYKVISKDKVGNSSASPDMTLKTLSPPDTTAPSVPLNLKARVISSSQINLSWSASADNVGVAGYKIYRNGVQIATSATVSYSNTGLTPATIYKYAVSAYDAAGNISKLSLTVSVKTLAAPDITVNFDNPLPTGTSGSFLNGVYQDINFGMNQWRWKRYGMINGTNCIYFDSNLSKPCTIVFYSGPKILKSMKVSTLSSGWITLSDDNGQKTMQHLMGGGYSQTILTNWLKASRTVTITFSQAWNSEIDDIVYQSL